MHKLILFIWRPRTTVLLMVGIAAVLVGLVISFMVTTFKPTTEVRLGSGVYSLWLANTNADQLRGLSGVEKLGANGGLLMVFDSSENHGIWMKDMNFSLDIIWLDEGKKVVYIVKNAAPERPPETRYVPKDPARYVVELPAGSVQRAGIKTGQIAEFALGS